MKFNFLEKISPRNKVENKEVYTEQDLQKADVEYRQATNDLNAVDFGAEDFDDTTAYAKVKRYKDASTNYQKIHRSLHPEAYLGENKDVTILPNVELTKEAGLLEVTAGLSTEGRYESLPKKK